jgi:hypothetical protein
MFLCVLGVLNVSLCARGIEHFPVLGVWNVSLCVRGIERFSVC